MCDFITIVKICEGDVYKMYCDNQFYFQGDIFRNFHALINFAHESISLQWITNLNKGIDHLAFKFVKQHVWATYVDQIGAYGFVTRHVFEKVVAFVKQQCIELANQLIIELQYRFLYQNLMDTCGVVYWL